MINNVVLMGRLTATPEIRQTQSGIALTQFTIAVERPRYNNSEAKTDFIDCVAWRNNAEFIGKYFTKGQMIAVTGSIHIEPYTDKNGNSRRSTRITVDRASFCGSKSESGGSAQAQQQQPAASYTNATSGDFEDIVDDDDDLPF